MARSVQEIKNSITAKYISFEEIRNLYELEEDKTFEEQFSKISLESIIFYCVAFAVWVLETLFDTHKKECSDLLDIKKPHRIKWYRDKALTFQYGRALIEDSDLYDNTNVPEKIIQGERVVKYAAVVENADGRLQIKVATGEQGQRDKLSDAQRVALDAYFREIKDAGVRLDIINQKADAFRLELDIYYDPMQFNSEGQRLDDQGDTIVQNAVKSYIENLPFNGEFSNMALIDALQKIEGVVIPELKYSEYKYGNHGFMRIDAKAIPDSGYLRIYEESDLKINWKPYQSIE